MSYNDILDEFTLIVKKEDKRGCASELLISAESQIVCYLTLAQIEHLEMKFEIAP